MKADISGGLRNALERGDSLEDAIQSFINAGYSESEVHEASKSVNVSQIPEGLSKNILTKKLPSNNLQLLKPQKRFRFTLITVLLTFLILLVIFFVASLFFQEEISGFFSSFLSS